MKLKSTSNFFMLIGICGRMGSGKDTVADTLVMRLSGKKQSFSAKLKEIAEDLFGIVKKDDRGRHIYQVLGDKMRDIDPDVWTNVVMKKYKSDMNMIISDVRYVNEAEAILEVGGTIIHLNVSDKIRKERIQKREGYIIPEKEWREMNSHSSETQVDEIAKMDEVKSIYVTPADDKSTVMWKVMRRLPKNKLGGYFD